MVAIVVPPSSTTNPKSLTNVQVATIMKHI